MAEGLTLSLSLTHSLTVGLSLSLSLNRTRYLSRPYPNLNPHLGFSFCRHSARLCGSGGLGARLGVGECQDECQGGNKDKGERDGEGEGENGEGKGEGDGKGED